jgi:integrase
MRPKYQQGSIAEDRKRAKWVFRWRDENGTRRSMDVGPKTLYKTKPAAERSPLVAEKRLEINSGPARGGKLLRDVVEQYAKEEMPETWSTRRSYWNYLNNHILPEFGDKPISAIKPAEVQSWLRKLNLSPKTRGNIKGLMHSIWRYAMVWDYLRVQVNPISIVRLRGTTIRQEEPIILTIEQFCMVVDCINAMTIDPRLKIRNRTMLMAGMALGLRCCELVGLKWEDIDFVSMVVHVRRSVVANRVKEYAKTKASNAKLPLDALLAVLLREWRDVSQFSKESDWVFASEMKAGQLPVHGWGFQARIIREAGKELGLGNIGWHTLRHTYRTWLDETGAPLKVMQELMRHADFRTTLNVYGKAMPESKRAANSKVVTMAARALPKKAGA